MKERERMSAKERAGSLTITFLFCARLCFCVSKKVTMMMMMTSSAKKQPGSFLPFSCDYYYRVE